MDQANADRIDGIVQLAESTLPLAAIERFITHYNHDPKPFVWTAKAEDILAKVSCCRRRLEQIQPCCTSRKSKK